VQSCTFLSVKWFIRRNTTTIHQFLGYVSRFLQNHLQRNVNHMEVQSVCTYIMGFDSVYIKS